MAYGNVNVDKIRESNINAFMMQGNVLAQHEGLICKHVTTTTVDIDADAILLLDSTTGDGYKAESINLTLAITTSGLLGLDTGSEANSTWYYLWVIYNGTTVSGIISTSSTAPTMPSGYTYKGLVGAVYNGSGGNLSDFHQVGGVVVRSTKQVLSAGAATTITSVDLATAIPLLAKVATGWVNCRDTLSASAVMNTYSTAGSLGEQRHTTRNGTTAPEGHGLSQPIMVAQTMWYKSDVATENLEINITGWEY